MQRCEKHEAIRDWGRRWHVGHAPDSNPGNHEGAKLAEWIPQPSTESIERAEKKYSNGHRRDVAIS